MIPGPNIGWTGSKQYSICCNLDTNCVCGQDDEDEEPELSVVEKDIVTE